MTAVTGKTPSPKRGVHPCHPLGGIRGVAGTHEERGNTHEERMMHR